MSNDEVKTVVELLKQAYMDSDWSLVLESVEILQREEEADEYPEEENEDDF
tara:strand:+ start:305 stop:457 length:153 start_codon:yes stop_codon:yes gene_type:complete